MPLNRETFFAKAKGLRYTEVQVPELGDSVFIRSMTGEERAEFEQRAATAKENAKFYSALLIATVCDQDKNPIFSEADAEDIENQIPWTALVALFNTSVEVNKLRKEHVEQAAKN